MSALPKFTMHQLLDAGVHFGHRTMRWNPRMAPFIFSIRNNIHILDLQQTVPLLHKAMEAARDVAANNGRILFVSTKRQASGIVAEAAARCGQYYVNHRWLGGMLTNWGTISKSIKTLSALERQLEDEELQLSKKERLQITRRITKLELALGGIRNMGGLPNMLFIIDTNKENIAIKEAKTIGIPVVAVIDSNSNPDDITHPIPGNDDATRAIQLYCNLIADSILSGMQSVLGKSDKDAGTKSPVEKLPSKEEMEAAKKERSSKKTEVVKKATKSKKSTDKSDENVIDALASAKIEIIEAEAEEDIAVEPVRKKVTKKAS